MKIKEICEKTGLTDRTVRYYIEEQLISPFYTENYLGRKSFDFSEQDLERLKEIATLRAFGFSVEEIKQLSSGEGESRQIVETVKKRTGDSLDESRRRLNALSALDPSDEVDFSKLAKGLSSTAPAMEDETARPHVGKRLLSLLKACAVFLAVWLPIISAIVVLVLKFSTLHMPIVRPMFLVYTLLCFLPSMITVLVLQKLKGARKILRMLLTTLCVLCLPLGVFFSSKSVIVCDHRYETYHTITEATCQHEGERVMRCVTCKRLETQTVEKLPHVPNVVKGFAPTCTQEGLSDESTCVNCHALLAKQTPIPPTNVHTPIPDAAVPATCKDTGLTAGSHCSVCDAVLVVQTVVPTTDDHTSVIDAAVTPTCGKDGLAEGSHCSVCNKIFVEQAIIPATKKHTPVTDAAVPTSCKADGLTEGSHCSVCNEVLVAQTVVPKTKNHTPVIDAAVPASCKASGLTEGSHCSVCDIVLVKQQTVPQWKHEYEGYTCKLCREQIYSQGLIFESIPGGYKLVSIGTCSDTEITVPSVYNGLPVIAIGSGAFLQDSTENNTIKSIVLRDGIQIIEEEAFIGCRALESILLPDSIQSIGEQAFAYNSALPSITIPNAVTVISRGMFFHCFQLKSVTLGNSVTVIEERAFYACGIESLLLPDTVERIEASAFKSSSLKACNIPSSLIYLGEDAFRESNIEVLVFGDKLSEIPARAFQDCDSLTSVTLNASIKKIGARAFYRAENLKTVVFSVGLEEIADEAFSFCSKITKLLLPEGLVSIGSNAFRYNESVTELILPSTLNTIGNSAFIHCTALTTVSVPAALKDGGEQIFDSCGLESVVLEEGCEVVYGSMFRDCKSLQSISLPSTLKTIETNAFGGCTALVISSLPDSLVSASRAFADCTFKNFTLTAPLSQIEDLLAGADIDGLFFGDGVTKIAKGMFAGTNMTAVEIPEGVTEIGEEAFALCQSLNHVSLPSTLTHIHSKAFYGCEQIATLTLPEALEGIEKNAFANCSALSEITVPNIELEGVFDSAVRTVHFLGTKEEAQAYIVKAFPYSSGATVYCLDGVLPLEVYSYHVYNTDISWVLTSDGTLSISGTGEVPYHNLQSALRLVNGESWWFLSVKKLVINEGITKFNASFHGISSFEGCANIEDIEFPSTLVALDKETFHGTVWYQAFNEGTESFYIGDTLVMVPSSASGTFVVRDGTVTIGTNAFLACKELTEIRLPLSVTTIESGAFSGCEALASLTLHEGIQTIGQYAINDCHALTELTIPSTVTDLANIISTCHGLKKIVLADSDSRTLNGGIASYCNALETVVIDAGVTALPINTLYACPSLQYVIVCGVITEVDYSAFWNTPADRKLLCYEEKTAQLLLAGRYSDSVYLYSEVEPSAEGRYWHFSEDGTVLLY